MTPLLRFRRLTPHAYAPFRATPGSAGYDLFSAYNYIVPAKGREIISTDLQIQLPSGCYGRIAPRSGLAAHRSIDVGAGVIDSDYHGNVRVVLFNFSDECFHIMAGDRIAQLICEKITYPCLEEMTASEQPACNPSTANERGINGFGWSDTLV